MKEKYICAFFIYCRILIDFLNYSENNDELTFYVGKIYFFEVDGGDFLNLEGGTRQ